MRFIFSRESKIIFHKKTPIKDRKFQFSEYLFYPKKRLWTIRHNQVIKTQMTKLLSFGYFFDKKYHSKYSHMGIWMKVLDEISSVVHMRIFWRSMGYPKWDILLKMFKNTSTDHFSSISIEKITFLIPSKNWNCFSLKIPIGVLKRTILMTWIRFSIIKFFVLWDLQYSDKEHS